METFTYKVFLQLLSFNFLSADFSKEMERKKKLVSLPQNYLVLFHAISGLHHSDDSFKNTSKGPKANIRFIWDILGTGKIFRKSFFKKRLNAAKNGCEEFLFLYIYYNSCFRFNSSGRKCHRD